MNSVHSSRLSLCPPGNSKPDPDNKDYQSACTATPLSDCSSTGMKSSRCLGRSYSFQFTGLFTIFIDGSFTLQEESGPLTLQSLSLQERAAQSLWVSRWQLGSEGPILLPLLGTQVCAFWLLETHPLAQAPSRRTMPQCHSCCLQANPQLSLQQARLLFRGALRWTERLVDFYKVILLN